jgi:hypothetical protein
VVSGNEKCRDGDDAFQVKRPIWRVGSFRVVSWSAGELSIGHTIISLSHGCAQCLKTQDANLESWLVGWFPVVSCRLVSFRLARRDHYSLSRLSRLRSMLHSRLKMPICYLGSFDSPCCPWLIWVKFSVFSWWVAGCLPDKIFSLCAGCLKTQDANLKSWSDGCLVSSCQLSAGKFSAGQTRYSLSLATALDASRLKMLICDLGSFDPPCRPWLIHMS